MFSSKITLQRGHWSTFPAENTIAYPIIELHFGHLIPIYNSMLPTPNNANALYNIGLKINVGIYFSVNANTIIAAKPIATKVKYALFRIFILSLGIIVSLYAGLPKIGLRWDRVCRWRQGSIWKSIIIGRIPGKVGICVCPCGLHSGIFGQALSAV